MVRRTCAVHERAGASDAAPRISTILFTVNSVPPILNHMVYQFGGLDRVFHALADPTRRAMLRRLSAQERTVSELAQPFRMSLAAASKHVRTLEDAGLVRRTVRGRRHFCRLNPQPLAHADVWLRSYEPLWTQRHAALEALLRHPEKE